MKKKFYAYGVLYVTGNTVGLTDKTLSDEMLKKIVVNSPLKVPVVNDLAGFKSNPDAVIGNCILMYQPDMDDGTSRLACRVEFNEQHRKEYEELLNGSVDREKMRFGFMLSKVRHDDKDEIVDGIINAVSFNENGLGGKVVCYGWGWEDESDPFEAVKKRLEDE